jgi:hypothetical protein
VDPDGNEAEEIEERNRDDEIQVAANTLDVEGKYAGTAGMRGVERMNQIRDNEAAIREIGPRKAPARPDAADTLKANKQRGDTFRDEIADGVRSQGREVRTEVTKNTPFGRRRIDVEVGKDGKTLGGIEAKSGNSRYLPSQRAKDEWLRRNGYPVEVVRDK